MFYKCGYTTSASASKGAPYRVWDGAHAGGGTHALIWGMPCGSMEYLAAAF